MAPYLKHIVLTAHLPSFLWQKAFIWILLEHSCTWIPVDEKWVVLLESIGQVKIIVFNKPTQL